MALNKAIVVGNLGRDPELKYLDSGTAVCNFSVATTERWKDKDGEKKEETQWHRCCAFGKTAEFVAQWFHKGDTIGVEGKIKTREWEKDGDKRFTTEIHLREAFFVGSKKDQADDKGSNDAPEVGAYG